MSTQEDADLQALWALVNKAKQRENYLEATPEAWRPQNRSDLAADDVQTAPYHLSHSAWSALGRGSGPPPMPPILTRR